MRLLKTGCVLILFSCGCYAQSSQAPASTDELKFSSFMLMSVGSVDHDPKAIAAYETSLVRQFGLNAQESAAIHAAGQTLHALLLQLRPQAQAIVRGKTSLSNTDAASLAGLIAQREQLITTLSNQILNTVRPQTADRLRVPGHIVAAAVNKAQGGN
jgi:hypothetical protein